MCFTQHLRKYLVILTLLVALASFAGCKKNYEEIYFKGIVRSVGVCTASSPSYLIEIVAPEGIGDTMTIGDRHYTNCVMGYQSPTLLNKDTVWGVGYITKDFALLHCNMKPFRGLPEMCILSGDEDPATVESALFGQ